MCKPYLGRLYTKSILKNTDLQAQKVSYGFRSVLVSVLKFCTCLQRAVGMDGLEIVDAHMHLWTPTTHPWVEKVRRGGHPAGNFGKHKICHVCVICSMIVVGMGAWSTTSHSCGYLLVHLPSFPLLDMYYSYMLFVCKSQDQS